MAYALGGMLVLLVATRIATPSLVVVLAGALFIGIGVWMFCSERYEHTLAVLMVYLGIADGYLKLKTGSSVMTLGRDALLYAIVIGAMVRWILRREEGELPAHDRLDLVLCRPGVRRDLQPGNGPSSTACQLSGPTSSSCRFSSSATW